LVLLEDINNKPEKHIAKNEYWRQQGIKVFRCRLPVGDYVLVNAKIIDVFKRKAARNIPVKMMDLVGTYNLCIDTKKDIQELIGDVQESHERFRDEMILARNNGIRLVILVENEGCLLKDKNGTYQNPTVLKLEDLNKWRNPRSYVYRYGKQLHPRAMKGEQLYKICKTMSEKYGAEFLFCTPQDAGAKVIEILKEGNSNG